MNKQRIWVFQQNGSAEAKIKAIRAEADDLIELKIFNIDDALPPVVDDTVTYLPETIDADMVLNFFTHPDLAYDLGRLCQKFNVPSVASGKSFRLDGVATPPTWCGLSRQVGLGTYGDLFGAPEFKVTLDGENIAAIEVTRGAPCGATIEAARKVIGLPAEEAAVRIGLETQFFCVADPSGWDPIWGKSPVHYAGKRHTNALQQAIADAKKA